MLFESGFRIAAQGWIQSSNQKYDPEIFKSGGKRDNI